MGYVRFILENPRFLFYGWLLSFGSSFGQTFFVGLFGKDIQQAFGLDHGGYGLWYSAATVVSGLALAWIGKRVDEVDLRPYTVAVLLGLTVACVLMAVAEGLVLLFLCFLLLRLFGQGLMSHTAVTAMARYFERGRGRAMSFASLGMTTGEAIMPAIVVAMVAWVGWRETWWVSAAVVVVVFIPLTQWLLRGHGERDAKLRADLAAQEATGKGQAGGRQWTRGEVMRDPRFYMQLPAVIAGPALLTGLFFHQEHVADGKGWTLEWMATCFFGFAAAKLVGALGIGPMIDRFGTIRLLPWFMPPLAVGLFVLGFFDHPMAAMVYMIASGLAVGAGIGIVGAMWAEIYGVRHVGAIRATVSAIMMFSTALAPWGFGALFDLGVSVEVIAIAGGVYCVAGTVLLWLTAVRPPEREPDATPEPSPPEPAPGPPPVDSGGRMSP